MTILKYLKIAAGSLLLAAAAYGILAAPGLLTDAFSTVPVHQRSAGVQP
jgi:hypothetical protein